MTAERGPTGATRPGVDRVGVLCVLGSAASFALAPVFGKVAYSHDVDPFALLAWRFVLAALLLWGAVAWTRRRGPLARPGAYPLVALLALGAVVLSGEVILYFSALEHIGVGLAETLLYLYPVWVMVIAAVVLRRPASRVVVLCALAAVAGAALTVGGVTGGVDVVGVLLAVGASVGFATYVVISSRLVAGTGPLLTTTLVTTGAASTFVVLAVGTGSQGPTDAGGWGAALGLAVVGTVAAFALLTVGLARLPAADASVVSTVEPAIAVVLGAALLGEAVSWVQALGVALVLGAVAVLLRAESRAQVVAPAVAHE